MKNEKKSLKLGDYFYLFLILENIYVYFYFINIQASIRNVSLLWFVQVFLKQTLLWDYAKHEYVLHNNNAANQWKRNCSDFWIMCQSNPRWMFLKKEINNYCVRDASSQCGAYHDKFFKLNQNIEIGISLESKNLENQNVLIWFKSQHGMC